MKARMRCALLAIGLTAALSAALPASAQTATGTPGTGGTPGSTTGGGSITSSATAPGAPLTAGTGNATFVSAGGGVDEEPLAHTGGGDLAFAIGSLVAAGGLGLRWVATRRS